MIRVYVGFEGGVYRVDYTYVYVSKQPINPSTQPTYTSTEALAGPSQSCAKVYGGGKVYRKDLPILQVRCAIPEAERTLCSHATGTLIGVNRLFGGVRKNTLLPCYRYIDRC